MLTTGRDDADHFHEECGVFGIFGHPDAAALTALGLHALQHRGQEAAGIVAYDGEQFNAHRGLGLVSDNFSSKEVIGRLKGHSAIGHVRYATTGEVALRNVQPLFADFEFGGLAICHNGNLTNSYQLRRQLVRRGSLFQSTSDTEVIVHLIATSLKATVVDRLIDALRQVEGAYSLVALSQEAVIGVRDPLGVRPLVLGRLGDAWIVASETCALDIIGADFVRDVEPGEIVIIDADGLHSVKPFARKAEAASASSNTSISPGPTASWKAAASTRRASASARELARESHVDADIVVPVPDSGRAGGDRLCRRKPGMPFELGIIRNHYVGRTFIEPTDQIRHLGVRLKHNANRADLEGKRVILVDDSIVRGTTSTKIVDDGAQRRRARGAYAHLEPADHPSLLLRHRHAGARPAARRALRRRRRWREFIGVDSLAFISIDGLYRAMGEAARDPLAPRFCDACFTGDYPIPLVDAEDGKVSVQLSLLAETA